MQLEVPLPVQYIIHTLESAGFEGYLVGGAVRDLLIKRPITDWDITTNANPEQIMSLFKHHYYENDYGTVGLPIEGLLKDMYHHKVISNYNLLNDQIWVNQIIDVTTYRFEYGYTDNRRPDSVAWGKRLDDDLSRRDFTINALAIKLIGENDVEIIDLYEGLQDLNRRLIKTVGNPNLRFGEDALRMMRAIRFGAQLQFQIDPQTLLAIEESKDLIRNISFERIRDEFIKIIASNYPSEGVTLLYNSGLLSYIIPEMIAMRGVRQGGHHLFDVWTHSLESLKGCPSSDPIVRLAALLHDIGKPQSQRFGGPRGVTFHGHEVIGARLIRKIGSRLKLPAKDVDRLETLVRWHMFTYSKNMTDGAVRRFMRHVGLDNINDMMLLRVGDRKGGGSKATSWRLNELQERIGTLLYEPLSLKDLAINGNDLITALHISPGPKIGFILNTLFEEVLDDSSKNTLDYLLHRAQELIQETK